MIRKKSSFFEKSSQNLTVKYKRSSQKLKQLGFTTNWNITQQKKQYDALQDPHANRYFRYESVQNHLKSLKKSLKKLEISNIEKKKFKKLFKQKLSDHLPAIKMAAQTYDIREQDIILDKLSNSKLKDKLMNKDKSNSQFLNKKPSKSKNKIKGKMNTQKSKSILQKSKLNDYPNKKEQISKFNDSINNQPEEQKQKIKSNNAYYQKQHQLIHKKKHQDFIAFIAKKKQKISSSNSDFV